ncbi:MAG: hypothetical protein MZV70_45890 [Desulfobacterales bacterium]|nr:hypothetical protein [Desulfobacterales bacterium]
MVMKFRLQWLGEDYFKTNTYIDALTELYLDCDTIAILNLTVLPIDTMQLDAIICIKEAPFAQVR